MVVVVAVVVGVVAMRDRSRNATMACLSHRSLSYSCQLRAIPICRGKEKGAYSRKLEK